ncbi:hypothetical protein [Lonepinella sp. BR2357]|uniref:hypothetical protein n=1 Tax=Lonepinella sp. BR2357 TaxID=3434549 RepID=UPI003F6DCFC0
MKKLILLLSLLITFSSQANLGDITKKQLKDYVVKGNNMTACFFPDVWYVNSAKERKAVLQRWRNDPNQEYLFTLYYAMQYPLLADSFGLENATTIYYGDDVVTYLLDQENISQKERDKITVKTKADCKKLKPEFERLFKEYPKQPYAQKD